jgi:hypothetical protein
MFEETLSSTEGASQEGTAEALLAGSCEVAIGGAACYLPGRSFPARGDVDERGKEVVRE